MPQSENQVAIAPRLIDEHVPCLVIVVSGGARVNVPLTAADNAILSQVRVAQLREVMDKQLELLKGKTTKLKPHDIQSLVNSYAKIEDMGRFAYAPALSEAEGGAKKGHEAAQMMRAVAEGAVTAALKANPKEEREKKILELGKKKPLEVIVEQPEKTSQEDW